MEKEKEVRIQKKLFAKLSTIFAIQAVIGVGGLVGWLAYHSLFLAGLMAGSFIGLALGFFASLLVIVAYAALAPEEFAKTFGLNP